MTRRRRGNITTLLPGVIDAMTLHLDIQRSDGQPLPPGSILRLEVRDTSLADAPAVVLTQVEHTVPAVGTTPSLAVTLDLPSVPDGATVWAHLSPARHARVHRGDFITTESYPVARVGVQQHVVRLTRVG